MATIPCRRAGDESPLETRRRTYFNPLHQPQPFNPLHTTWSPLAAAAGEDASEPASVPGKPVVIRFDNRT